MGIGQLEALTSQEEGEMGGERVREKRTGTKTEGGENSEGRIRGRRGNGVDERRES